MPFATYLATESIAPGHVLNAQYTIRFQVQRADQSTEILKREPRAMAGNKETLHFGRIRRWSITLAPFPAEELPYYEEFMDSTADGQAFILDPYGSELAPGKPMTVDREDTGHSPSRRIITGDPIYSDMIEISFQVSERA